MTRETENSQREARIARQRAKRRRKIKRLLRIYSRRAAVAAAGVLVLVLLVTMIAKTVRTHKSDMIAEDTQVTVPEILAEVTTTEEAQTEESEALPTVGIGWNYPDEDGWYTAGDTKILDGFYANRTDATAWPSEDDVLSTYALLINESTNEIVVGKNENTIISPASMTKILTVLVAAEHIEDLDDTFTITLDITDYAYVNGCSAVGFLDGETVTVRDLFYGTILPSGGDAAVALATYVAGSHEAFVDMMNEKLKELGLSDTAHFTNCIGLYNEDHYCTIYDMAMILKAAVENDWCREVLSAHVYTTTPTEQHPDGITISNWFLRRIEDKDTGGEVLCAKTGYVDQSRFCAASYFISADGTPYICVTSDTHSNWRCINDHVALYYTYAK